MPSVTTRDEQVSPSMFKGGDLPNSDPHRCPYNPGGATAKFCVETGGKNLRHNETGCCGTYRGAEHFGPYNSVHRRCVRCVGTGRFGLKANTVEDIKTGLCHEHNGSIADTEKRLPADPRGNGHVPGSRLALKMDDDGFSTKKPNGSTVPRTSAPPPAPVSVRAVQLPPKETPPPPPPSPPSGDRPARRILEAVAKTEPKPPTPPVMKSEAKKDEPKPAKPAIPKPADTKKDEPKPAWQTIFDRIAKAMADAEYVKIDPHTIQPMPGQPREYFDEGDLAELTDSIAEIGQIMPGIIRRVKTNSVIEYEIIDGERRLKSVLRSHTAFYKAMLVDIDDEAAPYVIAAIANFNRAAHTHVEISNAIEKMHNGLGVPIPVIAKKLNLSEHWVYQLHGLQKLHPRLRGLLDPRLKEDARLPVSAGIAISKVDPLLQEELVRLFRTGMVTLKGLRKKAVAMSTEAGTYIRKREADEPARKMRSLVSLSGALQRESSDLLLLLKEKGMTDIVKHQERSAHEILVTLKRAEDAITECRYIVNGTLKV